MNVEFSGVIGVLGLGPMGLPMARTLARAGFEVVGWNRSPVPAILPEPVAGQADPAKITIVDTPAEVGRLATTVISMITDLPPLLPLVLGGGTGAPSHLLDVGHRVDTLVVMSTCAPAAVRAFAADLGRTGVDLVDAPVSGGIGGATTGTLSILVGARPESFARVLPVLEVLGRRVTHFGPVGAGSVAKACNQLVVNTTVAALAEAVLLAERAGLDVPILLDALASGLAGSAVLDWKREAFSHNDFTPSGPVRLAVKDLGFATAGGRDLGLDLPVGTAALTLFREAAAAGLGDLDNAAVLEYLRRRSG
ncbi:MAG: NAD(P)-dependent oxidoreductase [Lapillicoccus sp.]